MMEMPPLPYTTLQLSDAEGGEPFGEGYTADDMRVYGEACALMAREEAAKVCEADALRYRWLKARNQDALAHIAYGASKAACDFPPSNVDSAIDAARKG